MAFCVIEETESSVTSTFVTPTFARWFNPTHFYLLRIGDVSGFWYMYSLWPLSMHMANVSVAVLTFGLEKVILKPVFWYLNLAKLNHTTKESFVSKANKPLQTQQWVNQWISVTAVKNLLSGFPGDHPLISKDVITAWQDSTRLQQSQQLQTNREPSLRRRFDHPLFAKFLSKNRYAICKQLLRHLRFSGISEK